MEVYKFRKNGRKMGSSIVRKDNKNNNWIYTSYYYHSTSSSTYQWSGTRSTNLASILFPIKEGMITKGFKGTTIEDIQGIREAKTKASSPIAKL